MSDEALLVDRYLDGALTPESRAELMRRLRADAGFRARFVAEVRLQGRIAGMLDGGDDAAALLRRLRAALEEDHDEAGRQLAALAVARAEQAVDALPGPGRAGPVPRPTRRLRPARPRAHAWALMAAALALMVGMAWMLATRHEQAPTSLATLADREGAVTLTRGSDAPAGADERALFAGDRIEVGAGGSTAIVYADGTRVAVSADSRVGIEPAAGKGLRLEHGRLAASVAKQAPGTAMVFDTPDARATVLGTRLALTASAESSRLEVSEGRVAFAPLANGAVDDARVVVIATGEVGEAARGAVSRRDGAHGADADALEPWARALARVVAPTAAERAWEDIPWTTDLWEARRRAHADGKPILLWAGWGDPLGMASTDVLIDRQRTWADAELRRLVKERFIAVAGDSWFLQRRQDAVGRFFAGLARQSPHPDSELKEGLYCLDADGRLLAYVGTGSDAVRVREGLDQALAAAGAATAAIPDQGSNDEAHDPHPPAGALVALVSARTVLRSGDEFRDARAELGPVLGAASREALWLSAPEWRSLLPPSPRIGQVLQLPDALARKIVRYCLVDSTRGESSAWEDEQVVRIDLRLTVEQTSATDLRLRLAGTVALSAPDRSFAPALSGTIVYDAAHDAITHFDLVALGEHRATSLHPAPPAGALLGIAISLADGRALLAHPRGLRREGYFAP